MVALGDDVDLSRKGGGVDGFPVREMLDGVEFVGDFEKGRDAPGKAGLTGAAFPTTETPFTATLWWILRSHPR
jgi:hypothetical protein